METPRELIRRAGERISQTSSAVSLEVQKPPQAVQTALPQPERKSSVYHQLMQRHDRMNPRHLQG